MAGVDARIAKSSLTAAPAFAPAFMLRIEELAVDRHRRFDRWIGICERCDRTFDSDRWDGSDGGYLYALRLHVIECDVAEKQDLVDRGNWAERCRRDYLDSLINEQGLVRKLV